MKKPDEKKKCRKCGYRKPHPSFFKDNKNKIDGLQCYCKSCALSFKKDWRLIHGRREARLPKSCYNKGMHNAKKRELEWSITYKQYLKFVTENNTCYYCDTEMESCAGLGLNRVNSKKGYTMDNIKRCCSKCNTIMNNFTVEDLRSRVFKIIKRMK